MMSERLIGDAFANSHSLTPDRLSLSLSLSLTLSLSHTHTQTQELKRAGDMHSRVDAWAPEEEKRIETLKTRLAHILKSTLYSGRI
jgi:hypothetical protein